MINDAWYSCSVGLNALKEGSAYVENVKCAKGTKNA